MNKLTSPKQDEFIRNATHRFNLKVGARRCGKTYLDNLWTIPTRILERSGKDGLFRDRTEFEVADVSIDGKSILINENQIDTSIPSKEFSFDFNNNDKTQEEILVELKSPLRFKTNGKYSLDFTASDFMKCLYRRAKTLCMLYGTWEDEFNYEPTEGMTIEEKKLRWLDFNHYSARQKRGMELGGAFGSFKLSGEFSNFELALFELNKITNAGKNTNFGLGQIDFWKR